MMFQNAVRQILFFLLMVAGLFQPSFAGDQKELRVMLDWFLNPTHAPLIVADQQGFFKKYHVSIKWMTPSDPSDTLKLVAANQADIGITYEPQFLLQEKNLHLPLIQIGVLIETPLDCLMVLKSSRIQKISDLKGKKIGYSSAATGGIVINTLLKYAGLKLSDVHLINVHYGLMPALLSKKVDAITGVMRDFEPFEAKQAGVAVQLFYPEENGMPLYDELILVTNKVDQKDPRIKLFLKAIQEGALYLVNHPQESWKQAIKAHPELNNEVNRQAWFATLPRFALRPQLIDKEQYKAFRAFLGTVRD